MYMYLLSFLIYTHMKMYVFTLCGLDDADDDDGDEDDDIFWFIDLV